MFSKESSQKFTIRLDSPDGILKLEPMLPVFSIQETKSLVSASIYATVELDVSLLVAVHPLETSFILNLDYEKFPKKKLPRIFTTNL